MSPVLLPRIGILAFMDDESRGQFAAYGKSVSTAPGEIILREGDDNTNLYVVISGAFDITMTAGSHEVDIDTVGEGDCIGEIAVFQPGAASATVKSAEAGQLWFITSEAFQQFLLDWPYPGCAVVLGINTLLSRRLKRANAVIKANELVPAFLSVRAKKRGATGKPKA
jgi:CRP/FNR family cyclic AMP-dependent transcriptional regulator